MEPFGELWEEATNAFSHYVESMNDTFRLLASLKTLPVSFEKRVEINQQRQRENWAREMFLIKRNALFKAVQKPYSYKAADRANGDADPVFTEPS